MKLSKSLIKISLALGLVSLSSSSKAESVGDNFSPFGWDVNIMYTDFSTNSVLSQPLETEQEFAGTTWKTFAFTRFSRNSLLSTGFEDADVKIVPYIQSTTPLDGNYFKALVHVQFDINGVPDNYPHSMKIRVSTSSDFSSADTQECDVECKTCPGGEYYFFDIPERQTNDYYRFEIDIPEKGPKDGWFQISEIFLYKDGERVKIDLDDSQKKCDLVALKGELHVKATEYAANGTVVNEDLTHSVSFAGTTTWTNRVAGQDEVFSIPYPSTEGNYTVIRAKAVGTDGIHSPEKSVTVNESGLVTSVDSIIYVDEDTDCKLEWFDTEGRRLNSPQHGINIGRIGSKVIRVILK